MFAHVLSIDDLEIYVPQIHLWVLPYWHRNKFSILILKCFWLPLVTGAWSNWFWTERPTIVEDRCIEQNLRQIKTQRKRELCLSLNKNNASLTAIMTMYKLAVEYIIQSFSCNHLLVDLYVQRIWFWILLEVREFTRQQRTKENGFQ